MVFETLLCILLYLGVIISPGRYSYQEIDAYETAHQQAIDDIHNDPVQEQAIVIQYTPQLEFLDLYDDDVGS